MRVFLPLFSSSVNGRRFALNRGNPGVGGTFFTTIQFGMLLARHRPDWQIFLVHTDPLLLDDAPENLGCLAHAHFRDFLADGRLERGDVVISPSFVMAGDLPTGAVSLSPATHVAWSRHPFDPALLKIAQETKTVHVVCVGEYQWHTNRTHDLPIHFIQEIFLGSGDFTAPRDARPPGNPVNIVHLSSLTPPKGFLDVARAWPSLKQALPGVRLHVIGGAGLYGGTAATDLIPTTPDFAAHILEHIPAADIQDRRVVFYGTLGEEKYDVIRQSDFAILNPTGRSEAFPASPLEMMAMGVPVIGSDDFGMADCMRFFPELSVHGPELIADRAHWLVSDVDRYAAMRQRSLDVASSFSEKTPHLLAAWATLLDSLSTGQPLRRALRPALPLHGSRAQLVFRRDIRPVLGRIKRTLFQRPSSASSH